MLGLILALLVLLVGCSDQAFNPITATDQGGGPGIAVDPDYIDFGVASRDDDAVLQTFAIQSVGETDLTVTGMRIEGDSPESFTLVDAEEGYVLPPGTEVEVTVAFEPLGANDQVARVIVTSDDPDDPNAPVELVGRGAVPELEISPDPLDFSNAYVGCETENDVTLTNVGTDTLEISDISWVGDDEMWLNEDYTLPITLEPEESTLLTFGFLPTEAKQYTGQLSVTSNEPLGVRTADQLGEGKYAGEYTDTWEIPTDPPSDILFAVDQSCSMDDDTARLANNFSTFINELSDYSNDWQIIVANDDDGCADTGILTPSTSDYEGAFSYWVQRGGGLYTESLLTVAAKAVAQAGSTGCNAGFLRDDAMLHIILVSDEPEQSNYTSGQTWDTLVQSIIDVKGSSGMVRISAIAGDYPSGCGTADPGSGYYEAVSATGGVFLSICSDWANPSNLAMLAEASINQDTFLLSHTAAEDTIVVKVNGATRTTWYYDEADNAVVFTEHPPGEGDTVEITYSGLANCD